MRHPLVPSLIQIVFLFSSNMVSRSTIGSTEQLPNVMIAQLFMAAVALVYAPLAPLVTVSAAVVFWISSIVSRVDTPHLNPLR